MATEPLPEQTVKKKTLPLWKVAVITGIVLGILAIVGIGALIYFPDAYLNKFVEQQIVSEFNKSYPEYSIAISDLHIYLLADNIELSSIAIRSRDSALSCSIDHPTVKGIGWWQLIFNGIRASGALDGSEAEAQNIVVKSQKFLHEVHCRNLKISLPDSVIIADSMAVYPMVNDSSFFSDSAFRSKRYRIESPRITINGSTLLALLQGKICHISSITLPKISVDMIAHKTASDNVDSSKGRDTTMLASLRSRIQLDTINMEDAHITYTGINEDDSLRNKGRSIHYTGLHASFKDSAISAKSIDILPLNQPDGYSVRCGEFHVSLRDSSVVAHNVRILPLQEVNAFFEASNFRQTRFSVVLPKISISGLVYADVMEQKKYQARSIEIFKPSVDIQVSVFKQNKKPEPKAVMPNEALAALKRIIHIDSVHVINGKITYDEHYKARSTPARISFNHVYMNIRGITNENHNGSDTADIHFAAEFMNGGTLTMDLQLPLTATSFSPKFSGSLTSMSLSKLNPFLEVAQHARITSGVCQSASVTVQVTNGKAKGSVRILYDDFKLAFLDKETKSDKGIFNIIKSFLANTFKFNSSNKMDSDGVVKLGVVNYTRKPTDSFIQFTWYSVRRGIADLMGFPDN